MSLEQILMENSELLVLIVIPFIMKMERRLTRLEWEFKKLCGKIRPDLPDLEDSF